MARGKQGKLDNFIHMEGNIFDNLAKYAKFGLKIPAKYKKAF